MPRCGKQIPLFLAAILLEGIVFLLPGIAVGWLLDSKYSLDRIQLVCVSFVGSGAAGYLMFWMYSLAAIAGRAASIAVLLASSAIMAHELWHRRVTSRRLREIAACALLMMLITTLYTALGFLYERSEYPLVQAELRFLHPLPIDNAIPFIFAGKPYHAEPVRPFLIPDWKSSDRPPLQAGLALLQFPLWRFENRGLDYQILATFLQSMWIASVWVLLSSLSVGRRTAVTAGAFCIFSGFFLIHTFYVWPKLLAASYFVLALSVLRFSHQGSLADVLLLFVALGVSLAVVVPRLTYVLLAVQVLVLFPLFAVTDTPPGSQTNSVWANGPDPGMVGLALLSLIGLGIFGWKIGFSAAGKRGSAFLNALDTESPQAPQMSSALTGD